MSRMVTENPSQLTRDLIEKVGLKRSYAYQLARGLKTPALPLAVKIENLLGIPARDWIDPAPILSHNPDATETKDNPTAQPVDKFLAAGETLSAPELAGAA